VFAHDAICRAGATIHLQPLDNREFIVTEHVILGAFLVIPLVLVVFLFSDEIIEEHRQRAQADADHHIDWRHPLRSLIHH